MAALLRLAASVNGRAFLTTVGGAIGYLSFCSFVGRRRLLPPVLARKLTHIGEPRAWQGLLRACWRACGICGATGT